MTRFLSLEEILELQWLVLGQTGGLPGLRDLGGLESAAAQPRMAFGGQELYPTLAEKAAALCFSLVMNHPFVDGNKRIGHAAMETFLCVNGCELDAPVDDQERIILELAAGSVDRERLTMWVKARVVPRVVN